MRKRRRNCRLVLPKQRRITVHETAIDRGIDADGQKNKKSLQKTRHTKRDKKADRQIQRVRKVWSKDKKELNHFLYKII